MDLLENRRAILAGGAALALLAGLGLAAFFSLRHGPAAEAPPASQGGLVVQTGRDDDSKLDPKRPLRCFVNGQFVGELPLGACAKRNGVATGALDVGLDPSGALAASNGASSDITPLPPAPQPVTPLASAEPPAAPIAQAPAAPRDPNLGACLRFAGGEWRKAGSEMSLPTCVQTLYAGQCVRPGSALYGRWSSQTLRLAPGRVEISPDNRDFHTLVEQGPGCSVPPA